MSIFVEHHCGHCHTCGHPLRQVLDGEEWCAKCGAYRRYQSHGWSHWATHAMEDRANQCPTASTLRQLRSDPRQDAGNV